MKALHLRSSEKWSIKVVELNLQPAFYGRHYSGLYKAVRYSPLSGAQLCVIFADYLPHPQEGPFRLLALWNCAYSTGRARRF
jgi:hypothetical protein